MQLNTTRIDDSPSTPLRNINGPIMASFVWVWRYSLDEPSHGYVPIDASPTKGRLCSDGPSRRFINWHYQRSVSTIIGSSLRDSCVALGESYHGVSSVNIKHDKSSTYHIYLLRTFKAHARHTLTSQWQLSNLLDILQRLTSKHH